MAHGSPFSLASSLSVRKAIVTGASGTVGSVLCAHLQRAGFEVIRWPRAEVPIDDYGRIEGFLADHRPEVVFHLAIASKPSGAPNEGWRVNWLWPSELAWACRELGVKLVHTSSAMVFSDRAKGPFTTDAVPDAVDGYGGEKAKVERRVRYQNPDATILRLGWQIGPEPRGNTMLAFFARKLEEEGAVNASTRWLPACSFLEDTVEAYLQALSLPPGTYHVDSNERWSLYDIACALSVRNGQGWKVQPCEDFVYDQRLRDERLKLPSLAARLPQLHEVGTSHEG